MKKILLVIDVDNPDKSALEFACYTAKLTRSGLTGIFVESLDKEPEDEDFTSSTITVAAKPSVAAQSITAFKRHCQWQGIHFKVRHDKGVPVEEVIIESRFADLMIISASASFRKSFEGLPATFSKKTMHRAECPVIIAPESFYGIDEMIFCYDNTASAVFAIKQFTYLFPELREKRIIVLHVGDEGRYDEEKNKLSEWMSSHYSNVHYEVLAGESESRLFDYICSRKNHLTVLGAYSRTGLSNFFRISHADVLAKTILQPIFIAHA